MHIPHIHHMCIHIYAQTSYTCCRHHIHAQLHTHIHVYHICTTHDVCACIQTHALYTHHAHIQGIHMHSHTGTHTTLLHTPPTCTYRHAATYTTCTKYQTHLYTYAHLYTCVYTPHTQYTRVLMYMYINHTFTTCSLHAHTPHMYIKHSTRLESMQGPWTVRAGRDPFSHMLGSLEQSSPSTTAEGRWAHPTHPGPRSPEVQAVPNAAAETSLLDPALQPDTFDSSSMLKALCRDIPLR